MRLCLSILSFSLLTLASCTSSKSTTETVAADNTLSSKEQKAGWKLLFDGTSTNGWHTFGQQKVGAAWNIENGSLHLGTAAKEGFQTSGGGDIVTDDAYENYHLKLEWKISKNGNSGIIFDVQDDRSKYEYVWHTGPEVQVLDNDGHPDGKITKHRAGDLYDLISVSKETVKPVGEWNQVEIIHNNGKLELRLNGYTSVSTTMLDDNWKALIAGSKFRNMPDFGKFRSGHIALQDHGNEVWFRNVKILKL
jgi:hypothetical protein